MVNTDASASTPSVILCKSRLKGLLVLYIGLWCIFYCATKYHMDSIWIYLTHWGRETRVCVGNLTIISSDNGLAPGRRQAIIWTNAGILVIGPLGTNISEILIKIHAFSFMKMLSKVSSAKWQSFCLGLKMLTRHGKLVVTHHTSC